MKYRFGFVSNSSSTSFTCCLTGRSEIGSDSYVTLETSEMYECEKGHTFSKEFLVSEPVREVTIEQKLQWVKEHFEYKDKYDFYYSWKEEIEKLKTFDIVNEPEVFLEWFADYEEEMLDYLNDNDENGRQEINSKHCPVCQFVDLPFDDVAKYMLIVSGLTRKEFAKQMKEKFGDYNKFTEFLKGYKDED